MNTHTHSLIVNELKNWMRDIATYPIDTPIGDECRSLAIVLVTMGLEYDVFISPSQYRYLLGERAHTVVTMYTEIYYDELDLHNVINFPTDNTSFHIINEFEQWIVEEYGIDNSSFAKKAIIIAKQMNKESDPRKLYKLAYRIMRYCDKMYDMFGDNNYGEILDTVKTPLAISLMFKTGLPSTFNFDDTSRYQITHHYKYWVAKNCMVKAKG